VSARTANLIALKSSASPKREQVLDAAEACFVRNGFDRATMQDIAREAAMSAANIYRYFESKEAVVIGLAERERERGAVLVGDLERTGDCRAALLGVIQRYIAEVSREVAVLRVDLWSEATRNPAIAAMVTQSEGHARDWFVDTLAALATSPDCDAARLYDAINPLMKGIIVNRAVLPDFDAGPSIALLHAEIDRGLSGDRPTQSRGQSEASR
jgi:TetR/AcrR family transcriptional repressor of uid operon